MSVIWSLNQTRQALGTVDGLPGNNPVQGRCYEEYFDNSTPALLSPVLVYSDINTPSPDGTVVVPAQTVSITQLAQGTCLGNGSYSIRLTSPISSLTAYICIAAAAMLLISVS